MAFDPKISLIKSWKFTPQVLILIILGIIVILGILILVWPEKEAPPAEITPKEETTEELLKRLAPAEPKLLTQEEKEELEELLKQLTPTEPKPMTEEEQKELEELLKQLTP